MKFGQLIEYSMRNIFLKKSCRKRGGETIRTLFSKRSKLHISLDLKLIVLSFIKFVSIACQVENCQNILNL